MVDVLSAHLLLLLNIGEQTGKLLADMFKLGCGTCNNSSYEFL